MRLAPGFLTLVALAACGGKAAKPTEISNQVQPPAKVPWTVDRVLGTLDSEASIVAYIDVDRVRTNDLVAGYVDQALAAFKDNWPSACNDPEPPHTLVLVANIGDSSNLTIWGVGLQTAEWMKCMAATAETSPAKITVDGDYATMTSGTGHMSYLVLDDTTMVGATSKTPLSRADLEARTTAREISPGLRDALSAGGKTQAPIWAVARGSSPAFTKLPITFRLATLAIDLSDHIDIDLDVGMSAADQAKLVVQAIQQQGGMAVSMGFVSALDARADGDAVRVHAELTKASIDKMIATLRSFTGSGGMSPFGPGGPGPTPIP